MKPVHRTPYSLPTLMCIGLAIFFAARASAHFAWDWNWSSVGLAIAWLGLAWVVYDIVRSGIRA